MGNELVGSASILNTRGIRPFNFRGIGSSQKRPFLGGPLQRRLFGGKRENVNQSTGEGLCRRSEDEDSNDAQVFLSVKNPNFVPASSSAAEPFREGNHTNAWTRVQFICPIIQVAEVVEFSRPLGETFPTWFSSFCVPSQN
jgi:hypothetical protein